MPDTDWEGDPPGATEGWGRMTQATNRADDSDRLRGFKAEFFRALGNPLRIWILEILRDGPRRVSELQEATGAGASSVSGQLAVLRGQGIVEAERHGTTIVYSVADDAIFELLDVARRIHNSRLTSTVGLLRLVEDEAGAGRAAS
jgi:DNA-binding transcriptional ArsR family regulator